MANGLDHHRRDNLYPMKVSVSAFGALLLAALSLAACTNAGVADGKAPASQKDVYERIIACLTDAGWTVEFDEETGGIRSTFPSEQEEAYAAEYQRCSEAAGVDEGGEPTDEEYEIYYANLIKLRACLIDQGLDLPDAPTFPRFVDLKAGWSPYLDIDGETLAQRGPELEAACPQTIY